jgi:transposase
MGGAGMNNGKRLVACDVHAHASWLVGLELDTGELWRRRVAGPPSRILDVLGPRCEGARLVYEAGPTGFGLARAGIERGVEVLICAPGSVPRASGDRVKTDQRDAERLLGSWRVGQLSFVRLPTVAEEAFRDLIAAREDARGDLMRQRHRLSKFLLRRELRCPGGEKAWGRAWMRWLATLEFTELAARLTFGDYVACVEQAVQRRAMLDAAIENSWPDSPFAATIARLRCFRGIDTLSGAGLAAEIGDFERFAKARRLAGFLGIVPSEHTSGERRRQGQITKAGPGHARRLLVEAAQHYRHRPAVGLALERRQAGQDPRVIACAWRAQRRLHARWQHLHAQRGKHPNVVTIAVARELSAFCWEAALID